MNLRRPDWHLGLGCVDGKRVPEGIYETRPFLFNAVDVVHRAKPLLYFLVWAAKGIEPTLPRADNGSGSGAGRLD